MSAKALHLNLFSLEERKPAAPIRLKIILPIAAGIILATSFIHGIIVSTQYAIIRIKVGRVQSAIEENQKQSAISEGLKAEYRNLQAEADQYEFYRHARIARGKLFKKIAFAVPESITLTALTIPPQPGQELQPPPGTQLPPLQGPTQTVERVYLQITGLAQTEQDVFQLMASLAEKDFADDLIIAEAAANPEDESPRVLAFRQESPQAGTTHRGVFFDIVYRLKPREFEK